MIHLYIPPRERPKRCDTAALLNARARVRASLEAARAEKLGDTSDRHDRHIEHSQHYRQTGDTE